jgi:hypothetical protein
MGTESRLRALRAGLACGKTFTTEGTEGQRGFLNGWGSFDCAAIRFALHGFAQDNKLVFQNALGPVSGEGNSRGKRARGVKTYR